MNKTSSTDKIILYIETLLHSEILRKITMTKKKWAMSDENNEKLS